MQAEEIDNFLRSNLFTQDTDRTALDEWSFARYTRVDRKSRVFNVYLHKQANGDIVTNIERVETDHENIDGITAHVTTDKLVEGISDLQTLRNLIEKLEK